jgi:hypothetical protein
MPGTLRATEALTYCAHRDVPPEWQAALEAIVPRSAVVPWLLLYWHAGQPYEPTQRWVVYECVPNLALVPPDHLRDLQGDSPRTRGTWRPDPTVPGGQRWCSDSLHSLAQWEIFGATHCYPKLFWIIQGSRGGHVWRLDHVLRNFKLSLGQGDVPNIGDLPYAEWDTRVAEQIGRYDRLRQWHAERAQPWTDRALHQTAAGLWVQQDAHAREQRYAAEMLKFLDAQIEDVVSDIPRSLLPSWCDLPPGDPYYNADAEALEHALTATSLSHAPVGQGG